MLFSTTINCEKNIFIARNVYLLRLLKNLHFKFKKKILSLLKFFITYTNCPYNTRYDFKVPKRE